MSDEAEHELHYIDIERVNTKSIESLACLLVAKIACEKKQNRLIMGDEK